ncbi:DUF5695 domain-containing protein [Sphingomonas sp. TDK1]|uniref:DUF5695 domain-containing protein n=1 Tax=Sphingomonas sp. TDK1 TaxID=453247 RepID=UPI0007D99817|nr:DUF5695 domain-containing protein [Sphingomonas sp. TDK1]OAN66532.1 hypothetical protein A7X12_10355 [Sphingomonas sp. TDK1]
MRSARLILAAAALAGVSSLPFSAPLSAQEQQAPKPVYPPIRTTALRVGGFLLELRSDTGTLARLSPAAEPAFDFVPGAREAERQGDGYNHIGDINLRLRTAGGDWRDFASARARRPIRSLPAAPGVLAAADISASMGEGMPLRVERRWIAAAGVPVLRFRLVNTSHTPVEIGGLGLPMVFDNIIRDRTLETAHAQASFVDPYIGRDAGYLQVTRLSGKGPALLVLPDGKTPLENYAPLKNPREPGAIFTDKSERSQVSEGFYDWTVASRGFVDQEWRKAGEQWNPASSFTLAPGEAREIGVRLVQAPSIRGIQATLIAQGRPVALGVPGYVVPNDLEASLFLHYTKPVAKVDVSPAGAMTLTAAGTVNGWRRYTVRGLGWGRARVTITYADGTAQTVSYFVTKPLEKTMADLGRFTTTKQWFDDPKDPFGRSPAILSYDREADKILTQEPRVWIAGMSDEGGAGGWIAAIMKQLDNPDPAEIDRLETLVDKTIFGKLQEAGGEHIGAVKKSLFYYDPAAFPSYYDPAANWKTWTSWSKKDAGDLGRSFNYPHVALGYWTLYRLARNHPGLVTHHDWRWYLDHARMTIVAMMRDAPYYTQFGQMEGEVFVDILDDLKREGIADGAAQIEALMKSRADHWAGLAYPFGSEMAWDSTGQPEVYAWMRYFDHPKQAAETVEVILGYDPLIPHWGYNGNARRYWDFLYGGKYPRIERQIHHYGSTNNALPLFEAFRANPTDLHLLRVAYGGLMGGITNIDRDGFGSAAFHSWPDRMEWDPYSGDYGSGYFAHAYGAATYLVKDPVFGWLGYGGNVRMAADAVTISPKDGARSRLFVAPAGLWITLEAGKIAAARYAPATGVVTLTLDPRTAMTPRALIRLEKTTPGRSYQVEDGTPERGGATLSLAASPLTVRLLPSRP